jgi:hypothetical protein
MTSSPTAGNRDERRLRNAVRADAAPPAAMCRSTGAREREQSDNAPDRDGIKTVESELTERMSAGVFYRADASSSGETA